LLKGDGEYLMDLQCVSGMGWNGGEFVELPSKDRIFIRLLKTVDGFIRHESSKLGTSWDVDGDLLLDTPWDFKLTQEVSVYIPRWITPAQSEQLKIRRSHTFTTSFENHSALPLTCHFNGRPDHLWDRSINGFLTGGPNNFRGLLDVEIEGTVDFEGVGLSFA